MKFIWLFPQFVAFNVYFTGIVSTVAIWVVWLCDYVVSTYTIQKLFKKKKNSHSVNSNDDKRFVTQRGREHFFFFNEYFTRKLNIESELLIYFISKSLSLVAYSLKKSRIFFEMDDQIFRIRINENEQKLVNFRLILILKLVSLSRIRSRYNQKILHETWNVKKSSDFLIFKLQFFLTRFFIGMIL